MHKTPRAQEHGGGAGGAMPPSITGVGGGAMASLAWCLPLLMSCRHFLFKIEIGFKIDLNF